jgi:acetyltransferase (GNAT) family protein
MTPAAFKRSIRDLQIWCSSCMVAFSGSDPIGVLIGAKRPGATLVHKIAVHPDHLRQGHARHLLASLGSKLAILGPPRMIAEVPETLAPACALFGACGYVQESILTDCVLDRPALTDRGNAARVEGFVIPVTIDDLVANGLLGEAHLEVCWERSVETLTARKDDIAGLAVASDERIEAYLLYVRPDEHLEIGKLGDLEISHAVAPASASKAPALASAMPNFQITKSPNFQILALRSCVEDGGARLKQLLSRPGAGTFRFPKVHPAEISQALLETLGFRPAGGHRLYAARARPA